MDCTNQPNAKFPPTHPLKAKKQYVYVVSALGFTYRVISLIPSSLLHILKSLFNTSPMQKKLCRRLDKSFLWLQWDHFCLASWGSGLPLEGAPSSKNAASPQLYYAASQSVVEVDPPTRQLKCNQCDFASIGGKPTDNTHERRPASPRAQVVWCEQSVVELDPPPKQHHLLRPIFLFQHSFPTANNCR